LDPNSPHNFSVGIAFTRDGKALATWAPRFNRTFQVCESRVRLRDVATGKEVDRFPGKAVFDAHPTFSWLVADPTFSHDGRTLVAWVRGRCYLWEVATGKKIRRFVLGASPFDVAIA